MPAATVPAYTKETAIEIGALYEQELDYVWTVLRRLGVRSSSDVEDLAHEVFVTAHKRWADFDQTRPVRPWLFGIAFRVLWAHRRLAHKTREHLTGEPPDVAGEAPSPEQLVITDDNRRFAMEALMQVDLESRAVLILYDLDGFPVNEIAAALGIAAPTVYGRRRAALGQLAKAVIKMSKPGGPAS